MRKLKKRIFACKARLTETYHHNDVSGWIEGNASIGNGLRRFSFEWEAKVYQEPSCYGIADGRVSKLHIRESKSEPNDGKPVIAYDRAWCHHWRKAPKTMQAVYRALLKKYN